MVPCSRVMWGVLTQTAAITAQVEKMKPLTKALPLLPVHTLVGEWSSKGSSKGAKG